MTPDDFRRLALELPDTAESSHMSHPDFRRGGKIFATLAYPGEEWGMVKLSPEQQDEFVRRAPDVFVPVKGAWGRQGSTNVRLAAAMPPALAQALRLAWETAAKPKKKRPAVSAISGKAQAIRGQRVPD